MLTGWIKIKIRSKNKGFFAVLSFRFSAVPRPTIYANSCRCTPHVMSTHKDTDAVYPPYGSNHHYPATRKHRSVRSYAIYVDIVSAYLNLNFSKIKTKTIIFKYKNKILFLKSYECCGSNECFKKVREYNCP